MLGIFSFAYDEVMKKERNRKEKKTQLHHDIFYIKSVRLCLSVLSMIWGYKLQCV